MRSVLQSADELMMTTINACTSAVLVGLNLFFCYFLILFSIHVFFFKKTTIIIILNLKNVTVFWGRVVFFFFFFAITFFSTDVISQTKEYGFVSVHSPVLFICLFGPFFFCLASGWFCRTSNGAY